MSSYTSKYPSSVPFDPAFKHFFEDFYAVSDTPDAHDRYVACFTENATLTMASKTAKGSEREFFPRRHQQLPHSTAISVLPPKKPTRHLFLLLFRITISKPSADTPHPQKSSLSARASGNTSTPDYTSRKPSSHTDPTLTRPCYAGQSSIGWRMGPKLQRPGRRMRIWLKWWMGRSKWTFTRFIWWVEILGCVGCDLSCLCVS